MFFERGTIAFFHKWDNKFLFSGMFAHKNWDLRGNELVQLQGPAVSLRFGLTRDLKAVQAFIQRPRSASLPRRSLNAQQIRFANLQNNTNLLTGFCVNLPFLHGPSGTPVPTNNPVIIRVNKNLSLKTGAWTYSRHFMRHHIREHMECSPTV